MAVFSSLRNTALVISALAMITEPVSARPLAGPGQTVDYGHPKNIFKRASQVVLQPLPVIGQAGGGVPLRLEINILQSDPYYFNLYILAMESLMKESESTSNPKSWFQIASIHGAPYTSWDEVSGGTNRGGYCSHGYGTFPTWHRPYLLLLESALYEHAQRIAEKFVGQHKAPTQQAANKFRMPYWDWAANPTVPQAVGHWQKLEVVRPDGSRETIDNPLYSYRFQNGPPKDATSPFNQMRQTVRNPSRSGNEYVSQPDVTNQMMQRIGPSLRSRVFNLFTGNKQWESFSNHAFVSSTGGTFDSCEGVHDTVHGTLGGGGHMSVIDLAAFDPIFWLHHTNIDRVFAIWQVLNPSTYVTPYINQEGTYSLPRNSREDANSPLTPFHATKTTFWTSERVRNIKSLGYSYQELQDWLWKSPQEFASSVVRSVSTAYGNQPGMRLFNTFSPNKLKKRVEEHEEEEEIDAAVLEKRGGETVGTTGIPYDDDEKEGNKDENEISGPAPIKFKPKPLKTMASPPKKDEIASIDKSKIVNEEKNTYNEYITNIKCDAASLGQTYNIHVFIGEVPEDQTSWPTAPSLVGTFTAFTMFKPMEKTISGTVPLTNALLNRIVKGDLQDLKPETVKEFVANKLQYRVAPADPTVDAGNGNADNVADLKVEVVTSEVQLPDNANQLPSWGPIEPLQDVTETAKAVQEPKEENIEPEKTV